jgi:hypothetical protein
MCFVIMAPSLLLAQYIAAWSTGGVADGDFGFTRTGQIDFAGLAIAATMFTAGQTLARTWRRHRQARKAAIASSRSAGPSQT